MQPRIHCIDDQTRSEHNKLCQPIREEYSKILHKYDCIVLFIVISEMNANITKRMTTFSLDEIPIAFSAYTLCDRIQYRPKNLKNASSRDSKNVRDFALS